jgi:hypothetical protein
MESTTISVTDISFQNIGFLLLNNLNIPVYNLTPEQQTMIQNYVQTSPVIFDKITHDIHNITKDGKIDLHDIPFIVQLLADSYTSWSGDNLIVFIKYIINVIIDSKFIFLEDVEKKNIDSVVDVCIQLLKTNSLPKVKSWFSIYRCW